MIIFTHDVDIDKGFNTLDAGGADRHSVGWTLEVPIGTFVVTVLNA